MREPAKPSRAAASLPFGLDAWGLMARPGGQFVALQPAGKSHGEHSTKVETAWSEEGLEGSVDAFTWWSWVCA